MSQFLLKVLISAFVLACTAELARPSSVLGALLASLPLTSVLAMIWLWRDGAAPAQIAHFSTSILRFVLASLVLFAVLPLLLRAGFGVWPGLTVACVLAYGAMLALLRGWGRV